MSISIVAPVECKESEQCLNSAQFSLAAALFFVIFYNAVFFEHVTALVDQSSFRGIIFIANVSLVLWLLSAMVIALITLPYLAKPILSVLFIGGASVAYFMDAYGVVIHRLMIQSALETDYSETRDLINMNLVLYIVALGVLPSLLLLKINLRFGNFREELWRKFKFILVAFIGCLALILSMSMDYASFFRNHKEIRQMANPLNFIYAGLSYATTGNRLIEVKPIENDAVTSSFGTAQVKPTLLILVVGETARADHFGINGYERDTTPLIAQQILSISPMLLPAVLKLLSQYPACFPISVAAAIRIPKPSHKKACSM